MPEEIFIKVDPQDLENEAVIQQEIQKKFRGSFDRIQLLKKSIDARGRAQYQLKYRVYQKGEVWQDIFQAIVFPDKIDTSKKVHIVGAGPAGLFAALSVIENGACPIIIERGKDVRDRRRDLAQLVKNHILNPESNYCFGEGGAGTYSDGKLYTRSKKRGDVLKMLQLLVQFGSDENILIDAHPHIGTNKLPQVISNIRDFIIAKGGEIHFNTKLTDLILENQKLKQIELNSTEKWDVDHLILATGHSARDIFELLHRKKIAIEAKPFALGVRVEHPQEFIDRQQYKGQYAVLPPASYSLVTQVDGRGVYSFCMCPGGIIAPCATDQEEVVSNGWSPSKRKGKFSNSGIVVELREEDWSHLIEEFGPLAALEYQRRIERACWIAGGRTQTIPAQNLKDFVDGKVSPAVKDNSYIPGTKSVNLHEILPPEIASRLRKAFLSFHHKFKNFIHKDAVIVAPESRTSSPVKIPRDKESLQHVEVSNLYPCGEGAGYAGGIISAAMDGYRIANVILEPK